MKYNTFINLSNHNTKLCNEKQLVTARGYLTDDGKIIDLAFPRISTQTNSNQITQLVIEYAEKIMQYDKPIVMLQGEFVFTYRLVCKLKEMGIKVVSSCSERKSVEEINEDGTVTKKSVFDFAGFREY